jgi:hypothetical protein
VLVIIWKGLCACSGGYKEENVQKFTTPSCTKTLGGKEAQDKREVGNARCIPKKHKKENHLIQKAHKRSPEKFFILTIKLFI